MWKEVLTNHIIDQRVPPKSLHSEDHTLIRTTYLLFNTQCHCSLYAQNHWLQSLKMKTTVWGKRGRSFLSSSTRLQYSNEPQLMLSIILPNLSVINHNVGVLRRDYNFIFFLFRFRHFPFPFIFFILLLSNLASYISLLPLNTPALFHLPFF